MTPHIDEEQGNCDAREVFAIAESLVELHDVLMLSKRKDEVYQHEAGCP